MIKIEKCKNCDNDFPSSLMDDYSDAYSTERICIGCKEYNEYHDWKIDVDRQFPMKSFKEDFKFYILILFIFIVLLFSFKY